MMNVIKDSHRNHQWGKGIGHVSVRNVSIGLSITG